MFEATISRSPKVSAAQARTSSAEASGPSCSAPCSARERRSVSVATLMTRLQTSRGPRYRRTSRRRCAGRTRTTRRHRAPCPNARRGRDLPRRSRGSGRGRPATSLEVRLVRPQHPLREALALLALRDVLADHPLDVLAELRAGDLEPAQLAA